MGIVLSCESGCIDFEGDCFTHGENYIKKSGNIGISYYCDLMEDDPEKRTKVSGDSCLNNFECSSELKCVSGICTSYFSDMVDANNYFLLVGANLCPVEVENLSYFCSNESQELGVSNIHNNLNCIDEGYSCYSCPGGFYYNGSLNKCVTGICKTTPGCLDEQINNSKNSTDYCPETQTCYECISSDFEWDEVKGDCVKRNCSSSPGCLNLTNLTDATINNDRYCSVGSCFICNYGRVWNNTTSSCVLSASSSPSGWNSVAFTADGKYNIYKAKDKSTFSYSGRNYYFRITSVYTSRAHYEIGYESLGESTVPLFSNKFIDRGDEDKYDLDDDGSYDLKIIYSNVSSSGANMSLNKINERYKGFQPSNQNTDGTTYVPPINSGDGEGDDLESEEDDGSSLNKTLLFVILGIIILIILIVLIFAILLKKKKSNQEKDNQQGFPLGTSPPANFPGNSPPRQFFPPISGAPSVQAPYSLGKPIPPRSYYDSIESNQSTRAQPFGIDGQKVF